MTLVNTMFNKCIVNKIREIIPTYRYNSLKEFYSKCSLIHTKIADEAIDIAIEENFEHEFELSIKYELNSESMYAIYGCMTQNGDTVPIYVHYYDENDYQYVDIKLNDDGMYIFINVHYVSTDINKYKHYLRTQLFYLEFCLTHRVYVKDNITLVHYLKNDIDISSVDFLFATRMLSLLSPSEKLNRIECIQNKVNALTQQQIDLICYGNHGFKRVCTLINHFIDSNYYNLFYFFLFHFMDEDPNEIRPVFYLGYFLTKLNVRDFGIDKDYIEKIKRFDYKLTRNDKITAKKIYNFFNDYFNQYIYDFYKVIDSELDKKHEYDM